MQPSTGKALEKREQKEGEGRYILPFLWMLLLTAASFILAVMELMPLVYLIPILLGLAGIQVLVQLFTFMHLDQRGSKMMVLFTFSGCIIAATCILAMIFLV